MKNFIIDVARVRSLFFILCCIAAATINPAVAQNWPQKPIRTVVPFSAGSAVDIITRLVLEPCTILPRVLERAAF
jgi:tripartite-type tricarboxylate transporter receptor subunit TctC